MEDLASSISQYEDQLSVVKQALQTTQDASERESLSALQSELQELINLTKESLDAQQSKDNENKNKLGNGNGSTELDDEYALFMKEMEENETEKEKSDQNTADVDDDSDIEDELATLLGMKCAVYHTHTWGGQPSLHNAMVGSVVPRQEDDQFSDLQVRILFTHPTHPEMLPCPFYLNGDCKFSDEQCRYSHGTLVQLSHLKEAIEPNYEGLRAGSRILMKLKPPDDEDMSTVKKSSEVYHLWQRAIVTSVDSESRACAAKLENGVKAGGKRKSVPDEYQVKFEDFFPLGNQDDSESDLSDTEYPDLKAAKVDEDRGPLSESSTLQNVPMMGEWERYTRGMGSKIMLSMGYVPGTGLGATGEGRLLPVEARVMPAAASLDRCMELKEKHAGKDPFLVEKKLKRLQKREEERSKRAYEREKERERRNVFNFLNNTLGGVEIQDQTNKGSDKQNIDVKQLSSKDLNIEKFKLEEDCKKIEMEILKLNTSLSRHRQESTGHSSLTVQLADRNRELDRLRNREHLITKEQNQRRNKHNMTVF